MSYYTDLDDYLGQCEQAEMDAEFDDENEDDEEFEYQSDPKRELLNLFNFANIQHKNKNQKPEIDYIWTMQDGTKIRVKDMKTSHLKNSLAMCKRNKSDPETIKVLSDELSIRTDKDNHSKTAHNQSNKFEGLTGSHKMMCHCGALYTARIADLKRGWALSCSKRCAAIKREFGRPDGQMVL